MICIERHPNRSQLLVFGFLWLLFLCFWGTALWLKSGVSWKPVALWTAAVAIPAVGLAWPSFMRKVYLAASYITLPIGIVISFIALIAIYYVVLSPIALILRLKGYDSMRRSFDRSAETYWTRRSQERDSERYFKQF